MDIEAPDSAGDYNKGIAATLSGDGRPRVKEASVPVGCVVGP